MLTISARAAVGILALLALLAPSGAGAVAVRKAPPGLAAYGPPHPLPGSRHGDLIWARSLTNAAALPAAAVNELVLYRSTTLAGRPIAVSGTVAIPRGQPPRGGWRVISWAHPTTGVADICAPSRDRKGFHVSGDIPFTNVRLNRLVKAGYVVVRTDYEGLGTPGPHPFEIGHSEARGVIDIVRAARMLDSRIGPRWVVAGHSQGGQAALFAAADAARWAPELKLAGVGALAPTSHWGDLLAVARAISTPAGLSAYGGLLAAGVDAVDPALHIRGQLTPQAKALAPQLGTKCLDGLFKADSWGSLVPSKVFTPGGLAALSAALAARAEPGTLKLRLPTLIGQGSADTTAFKSLTDKLVAELTARGDKIDYRVAVGVTHHGVIDAEWPALTRWVKARLR